MSFSTTNFDQRLRRISKERTQLASGRKRYKVGKDGLIRPHRRVAIRPNVPMRILVVLIGCFVVFKSILLLKLGEQTYVDRLDNLNPDHLVDKVGGFMMQLEPLTRGVSYVLGLFFG